MTGITLASRAWRPGMLGLLFLAILVSCGPTGGDFLESIAKLITARFVPGEVTLAPGEFRSVVLEVTCDKDGLDTVFGRLGVRIKLDPQHTLPSDISATLSSNLHPDDEGFTLVPCNAATSDPNLRVANIPVQIQAVPGAAAQGPVTLVGYVEVEPLVQGEPSKDNTQTELTITIAADESPTHTGGCCTNGVCTAKTSAECTAGGGVYLGDNSGCSPGPCQTGACCLGPTCNQTTADGCAAQDGVFKGVGSSCTPSPCAPN